MIVSRRLIGKIVVNHMGEIIHIQPPGRHIRSHQQFRTALTKPAHHRFPLRLTEITVETVHRVSVAPQLGGYLTHTLPSPAENNTVHPRRDIDETPQGRVFIRRVNTIGKMTHVLRAAVALPRDNFTGIIHILRRDTRHRRRHRSREEQSPAIWIHGPKNRIEIILETRLQHSIGLIENEKPQRIQVHHTPFQKIPETAGSGDYNGGSPAKLPDLRTESRPPVNRDASASRSIPAVIRNFPAHLQRQFPCRRENERLGARLPRIDSLEYGQSESRGFPGTGLRKTHHIPGFLQEKRNHLGLNRRRRFKPPGTNILQKAGIKAEIVEISQIILIVSGVD